MTRRFRRSRKNRPDWKQQQIRREKEREARKSAVFFCNYAQASGMTYAEASACLSVCRQTACQWRKNWKKLGLKTRGRPQNKLEQHKQVEAVKFLQAHWPHCSRERLRLKFPENPLRALDNLHRRIDRLQRWEHSELIYTLTWKNPGRVWAMDYTEPPMKVDGIYGKILNVRDLASGKTLASLPVDEESGAHTRNLLLELFVQYGAPLVIKSDNGSPLICQRVRSLLDSWGVTFLLSPPYWPRYNGSCEAGNGSLKIRAHHLAAANDRVDDWSCEDVEGARLQANELVCNRRYGGLSPDEIWQTREPITATERENFRILLQKKRKDASIKLSEMLFEVILTEAELKELYADTERDAVRRTLESSGLLIERSKRIPLRKKR